MNKNNTLQYWSESNFLALETAKSYDELAEIALEVLRKIPGNVCQVCGPISSGGLGSINKNLIVFNYVIKKLGAEGHIIFDQMPFEKSIKKIRNNSSLSKEESNLELLEQFYRKIFESKILSKVFFIPGWESSQGATWERKCVKKQGIELVDLSDKFLEDLDMSRILTVD